jgi:hypothetical protein
MRGNTPLHGGLYTPGGIPLIIKNLGVGTPQDPKLNFL